MDNNVKNTDPISICDALECINNRDNSVSPNILSGIEALDEITSGWAPGEFCILGASIQMGKTSFVLSCISNMVSNGTPVAIFSATDSCNEYFLSRVVCALENRVLPQTEERRLMLLRDVHLKDMPLNLCFNLRMTLSYIHDTVEALINEKGVRCVFIDTIQSIFVSEDNCNTRENMAHICHELKIMAREFNIPFIVTSELCRTADNRRGVEGKKPRLTDLWSKGVIEQEADSVYFFFRPEYYGLFEDEEGNDLRGIGEIIVAKNHMGACGTAQVLFNHSTITIEDIPGYKEERMKKEKAQQELIDKMRNDSRYEYLTDMLGLEFVENY